MGLASSLWERRGAVVEPSSLAKPSPWLVSFFGGGASKSGVQVNEETALTLTSVWAAVNVISTDLAKLPIKVLQAKSATDRQEIRSHPVHTLLNRRPNQDCGTAFSFRQTLISHALLWGNGFAYVERDGAGRPLALWHMLPNRTRIARETNGSKRVFYEYYPFNAATVSIPSEDVVHVRGLSFDGVVGYSVVSKAREAWGAALACQQFAAAFWSNGALPSGVIEYPGELSPTATKNLRESFQEQFAGVDNAGKPIVLEEGAKFTPTSVAPDDAQFLESRTFARSEVAAWFRLSPHKIGDLSRSSFSNISSLNQQHVSEALIHWAVAFEQEVNSTLFTPSERDGGFYVEHNFDAFLRGDMESRSKAYMTGRQAGYLSVNDIRAKENEPSIGPEGDIYLQPVNMVDVRLANKQAAPTNPASPPKPPKTPEPPAKPDPAAARAIVMSFKPALGEVLRRNMKAFADRIRRSAPAAGDISKVELEHRDHMHGQVLATVESIHAALEAIGVKLIARNAVSSATFLTATRHAARVCNDVVSHPAALESYGQAELAETIAGELLEALCHDLL